MESSAHADKKRGGHRVPQKGSASNAARRPSARKGGMYGIAEQTSKEPRDGSSVPTQQGRGPACHPTATVEEAGLTAAG